MLYNTGTIAINGNTATGTGTNWTAPASQIRVGQTLFVLSNPVQMFQITAINSATSMTVTPAASPALSGQKYGILVSDIISVDGLAQAMSQLIKEYDENIGAWETFATTSANQNITVTINGTHVTIPAIGKLAQKGSNGAIPIGQGGTGATNADDARTNLGLGSSATKNVGGAPGNVMEVGAFGVGLTNFTANSVADANDITFNGFSGGGGAASVNFFDQYAGLLAITRSGGGDGNGFIAQLQISGSGAMAVRGRAGTTWSAWMQTYSTGNTIKASDGTLKAASPVVKLFADGSFETNEESEGCTVTRIKTGEYLIEGCMGLNSDAAWGGIDGGFDIPKDRNGQALIWLDYEVSADGSVLVKTFHREYPTAPAFARNSLEGYADGDPSDIPIDQYVSVRIEMPENSIWNQRTAMVEAPDSTAA
jgi:hypothetical protein